MLARYFTVKEDGEHGIVIQKSRFISYVKRVTTEEEAQQFIQDIKKKNWNATHNCSAYLIGENDHIQKANDDGEPSGTAGIPILEVLKKRKLKNTVVVITRYFGGIKLGAGGLIRAYGKSTSEGLIHTGIVECILTRIMHTTVDYTWVGKLENELHSSSYIVKNTHYLEDVTFDLLVEDEQIDTFIAWMTELTNGKSNISLGEHTYIEKEVQQ